MFCCNCGKEIADGQKFCTGCGATIEKNEKNVAQKVISTSEPVNEPVVGPGIEQRVQQEANTVTAVNTEKNIDAKNGILYILIGVLATLILIGLVTFGIFFVTRKEDDGCQLPPPSEDELCHLPLPSEDDYKDADDAISVGAGTAKAAKNRKSGKYASVVGGNSIRKSQDEVLQDFFAILEHPSTGYTEYGNDYYDAMVYSSSVYDAGHATSEYILPGSDVYLISEDDLYGFDEFDCKIARNEIYARYGRKFDSPEIQEYFDNCSWYVGTIKPSDFSNSLLSDVEIKNLDTIIAYEKKMGYR